MKERSIAFRCLYNLYNDAWIGKWYTRRQLRRVKQRFPSGHSHKKTYSLNGISITAIPINKDNYGYVIVNDDSKDCVLIDVGDCDPCIQFLHSNNYIPSAVLTTHKHWDHCYGNKGMLDAYPNLKLYGSKVDRPYGTNVFVKEGDESIEIDSFRFSTLFVPGHTKGHIIYRLLNPNGQDCLFTGDFLFIGGIGHIFEGTTKRALKSLNLLQCLPRSALIFPGHEYSLKNIQFASKLQPENKTLKRIEESVRQKRIQKMPSMPTTLCDEFEYNPFLRTHQPELWMGLSNMGYIVPEHLIVQSSVCEAIEKSYEEIKVDKYGNETECEENNEDKSDLNGMSTVSNNSDNSNSDNGTEMRSAECTFKDQVLVLRLLRMAKYEYYKKIAKGI